MGSDESDEVDGDETETLEEGDEVKGDETETLPLTDDPGGNRLLLGDDS